MTLIIGNTYPVKEQLKALGGIYDGKNKGWRVPDDKATEARYLVQDAPRVFIKKQASRYGSNYARFSSGAETYSNKRGRCEDAPCCGCCS